MCIKRYSRLTLLFISIAILAGPVFPQIVVTQQAETVEETRGKSILDIPDMEPVDIDTQRLSEDTPSRSSGHKNKPVLESAPDIPAAGDLNLTSLTESEPVTTDTDSPVIASEEEGSATVEDPSIASEVKEFITEVEMDEYSEIIEEDSTIKDKELEFLHQSGSLQENEPQVTPAQGRISPELTNDPYNAVSEELNILGENIKPGQARRLRWVASETFYGGMLDTPVHVIRGNKPGLTLCLTAAVHGDELNGVEIVRRLVDSIMPDELSGTIIGVPIVNLLGFTRGSRYLPDRRDLNRFFPGNPRGSSASRIAASFMEEIIIHCDRLVDLHTGSLNRTNLPQLRANLDNPDVVEFTRHFGSTAVLHSRNIRGNLRTATTNTGIPTVTLELGEPGSLQEKQIDYGVKVIETLLDNLDLVNRRRKWSEPQPVYYSSRWVRVNNGGLLTTTVKVGAKVKQGNTLGIIVNPITSESYMIKSPYNGRVLGMSLNQFMLPGYAAFNIGIVTSETEAPLDAQAFECMGTDMAPDQVRDEFDCSTNSSDEAELPYDERDEMLENIE